MTPEQRQENERYKQMWEEGKVERVLLCRYRVSTRQLPGAAVHIFTQLVCGAPAHHSVHYHDLTLAPSHAPIDICHPFQPYRDDEERADD